MLIGDQKTGHVSGVVVTAQSHEGLRVMINGKPAHLAIVDQDGHTHAAGEIVAKEVFAASVNAYRDFLRAEGHLRTVRPVN